MTRDQYSANAILLCARGEAQGLSKLTDQNVADIRAAHKAKKLAIENLNSEFSARALAQKYNVHEATIEKVLSYSTWKHVK